MTVAANGSGRGNGTVAQPDSQNTATIMAPPSNRFMRRSLLEHRHPVD